MPRAAVAGAPHRRPKSLSGQDADFAVETAHIAAAPALDLRYCPLENGQGCDNRLFFWPLAPLGCGERLQQGREVAGLFVGQINNDSHELAFDSCPQEYRGLSAIVASVNILHDGKNVGFFRGDPNGHAGLPG